MTFQPVTGQPVTVEPVTITDRLRFPEGPISLPGGDLLVVEIAGKPSHGSAATVGSR